MRPDDRKYTKTHEWVKQDGDTVVVGITDHAIEALCSGNVGDLVYCDLPAAGRTIAEGETFGEIESVKAVSDLNAPVGGEIIETNAAIEDHLEILSDDPWNKGWMIRIKPTGKGIDEADLMDAEAYEAHTAS